MSDYERLALKLEGMEFGGAPVGVLVEDAQLAKILGVRTRKVFKASEVDEDGELLNLEELYADEGPYRSLAIGVDKDKELTRAVLEWALRVMPTGGELVLVGEKRLGVQSFEKVLAEKMEGVAKMPIKDIGRLSFWRKNEESEEKPAELWKETKVEAPWVNIALMSLPGVFARGELDKGTAELLEVLEIPAGDRLLDLACGGGVVGAWAKKKDPSVKVTLTDVDANAVASAKKTFEKNNLTAEGIYCAEGLSGLPKGAKFDVIALNPPFHNGQTVDYRLAESLMEEAKEFLIPNAQIIIVANKFCPYEKTLQKIYGNYEKLKETAGFKVLRARRR